MRYNRRMTLYVRFIFCLAFGLLGLGLVLTIVLEEFFGDWNAARALHAELSGYLADRARVGDEVAARLRRELERASNTTAPGVRQLQQRREQLKELASIERRLQAPREAPRGVIVTPLPFARNQ